MNKKIDWLDVFGTAIAVLTCVTTVITAAVSLLNEIHNLREAHNERLKAYNEPIESTSK